MDGPIRLSRQRSFYIDLREDVLLDTIQEVGISPGGVLNGTYLFATVGSQMKLIREGSALHTELIGATTRRNSKKISSKDLEVGGVYATISGQKLVFGGFVDTIDIKSKWRRRYDGYNCSYHYVFDPPKPMKKAQLWLDVPGFKDGVKTYKEAYSTYDTETFEYIYISIDILKDKKVLEKIGQLETTVDGVDYITFAKEKSMPKVNDDEDSRKVYSKIYNMVPSEKK